jgi:hypothetical protein
MKQKLTAVDVRALVLLLRKKLIGLRYAPAKFDCNLESRTFMTCQGVFT